jgi:hypothetical protein
MSTWRPGSRILKARLQPGWRFSDGDRVPFGAAQGLRPPPGSPPCLAAAFAPSAPAAGCGAEHELLQCPPSSQA